MERTESATAVATAWSWLACALLSYMACHLVLCDEDGQWWLFHAAFLGISGIFLVRHTRIHNADPRHPLVPMIALLYLYATGSAIHARANGQTYHGVAVTTDLLAAFYLCVIVGLVGLIVGAWTGYRGSEPSGEVRRVHPRWTVPDGHCSAKLLVYGVVFAMPLLPAVIGRFNPFHVQAYTETACESRIALGENPLQAVLSVTAGVPSQYLFAAAILLMLRERYILFRIAGAAAVALYTLVPLRGGYRGEVIGAALVVLAVYHYRIRRLGLVSLVAAFVLGYVFITAMACARQTSDPFEMASLLVAELNGENSDLFSLGNSSELWTAQNLVAQIRFIQEGTTSFTYGTSVVSEFLVFIPRVLFPDRPLPLDQEFTEIVSPGDTALGKGYGLFILQEGYWVCGVPGVLLSMFCVGWFLERSYRWFMQRMHYDQVALSYGALLRITAIAVRGGIIGDIKTGLVLIMPFFLLSYLPDFVVSRSIDRVNRPSVR